MTKSNAAILAFVIAYFGSRALFAATHFRYQLFTDPFDLAKFAIDFGFWFVLYALSYMLLRRFLPEGRA